MDDSAEKDPGEWTEVDGPFEIRFRSHEPGTKRVRFWSKKAQTFLEARRLAEAELFMFAEASFIAPVAWWEDADQAGLNDPVEDEGLWPAARYNLDVDDDLGVALSEWTHLPVQHGCDVPVTPGFWPPADVSELEPVIPYDQASRMNKWEALSWAADRVEDAVPVFEAHQHDPVIREAVDVVRRFSKGEASKDEVKAVATRVERLNWSLEADIQKSKKGPGAAVAVASTLLAAHLVVKAVLDLCRLNLFSAVRKVGEAVLVAGVGVVATAGSLFDDGESQEGIDNSLDRDAPSSPSSPGHSPIL